MNHESNESNWQINADLYRLVIIFESATPIHGSSQIGNARYLILISRVRYMGCVSCDKVSGHAMARRWTDLRMFVMP